MNTVSINFNKLDLERFDDALSDCDIPHLWTAGEIADAMQECGL